ncbi:MULTISPECIES: GNAT family N-acetyltransferase [unclassified Pseudomonas]|uniref:GNAT family N-acetyltransferase n=1 Tax=unclassified Pseudomonas TaxID=196821 RepID=UPI000BCDFBED|nr:MULTISPECIES: GNAT family N-acetyltransferase [unclassified Pseudomonas]PVZ13580.1 ribosomal protein S18 acetylase RimI-like enzyme [Pseudomonas sp. URIL14HWK12:I12]PVZ23886.1 ribosomal protein S18 acetylase RimI-like enzyme [Pseudomonas sp. URIL14HWK12:I10]PVZ33475.1 ribosomal protein S18 acetylase RimI-like enzyme [Pseudomonas sp. URIL14HWK12:I11]SNZ11702.1 Ribosomal protein S18 acetylase RimI [Pseudomonas sp. URIL14HWK12:I9]
MSLSASPLRIKVAGSGYTGYVLSSDFSFIVDAYCQPEVGRPVAQWRQQAVAPFRKHHDLDPQEYAHFARQPGSEVFVAWLGERQVGHCVISRNWNNLAYIDELAVDAPARRQGVAGALLQAAKQWAHERSLPGVMLEAQNDNLPACRLYERAGFVLGGLDTLRYRGLDPQAREIALFWYCLN